LLLATFLASGATGQIPAPVDTVVRNYRAAGATDQPFELQVINGHRTVANTLLLRLAITNRGTAPMAVQYDFAGSTNPAELGKISALYVLDPNGRKKYEVLRDASGTTLCSRIDPAINPGERRLIYAQLAAPPDTSSSFDLYFPKADPILNVPIGLPGAGEPIPPDAPVTDLSRAPGPASPVPPAPSTAIDQPTSNNQPDVYTNQTNLIPNGSPGKAIGSVESANSTVPFTVEVQSLKAPAGQRATLRLTMTNNGSGNLIDSGQFTSGISDLAGSHQITGVYLVDPATKQRFDVVRDTETSALCSRLDRPFDPGESRPLEATFPPIPATVKSVYVYFPHASPITNVPVTR
jgi:hypothetical protein